MCVTEQLHRPTFYQMDNEEYVCLTNSIFMIHNTVILKCNKSVPEEQFCLNH